MAVCSSHEQVALRHHQHQRTTLHDNHTDYGSTELMTYAACLIIWKKRKVIHDNRIYLKSPFGFILLQTEKTIHEIFSSQTLGYFGLTMTRHSVDLTVSTGLRPTLILSNGIRIVNIFRPQWNFLPTRICFRCKIQLRHLRRRYNLTCLPADPFNAGMPIWICHTEANERRRHHKRMWILVMIKYECVNGKIVFYYFIANTRWRYLQVLCWIFLW